jgi:hypothetical protein
MKEHLLFIRIGLPCEEQAMRAEAQRLENEAGRLLDEARHLGGRRMRKRFSSSTAMLFHCSLR